MTATSLCGSCGAENPPEAIRCTQCADYLDPSFAPRPSASARPLDKRPLLLAAAVASVLVVLFHLTGVGFTMRPLPAAEPPERIASRIEDAVARDELSHADARAIATQLSGEAQLRQRIESGQLRDTESSDARARLPGPDQATVLGLGGIFALLFVTLSMTAASIAATALARSSRVREVGLGLVVPMVLQGGLWLASVEMDLAAITKGRLWLVGTGPAFEGAPALLLVMSLVASTSIALLTSVGLGAMLDHLAGRRNCPHCDHVFSAAKHADQCPACLRPLQAPASVRLDAPGGGTTRAAAGTEELLCTLCAATYRADHCPHHPHEPLLDPTRDDVQQRLFELDADASRPRFTAWTAALHRDLCTEGRPPTTAGLCMECAKTYDGATCPVHPDEPLLDPSLEDVRLQMVEADDRRRRLVGARLMIAGFVVAVGVGLGVSTLLFDGAFAVYLTAGAVAGLMAVARALTPALSPRRFAAWTLEGTESPEDLRAQARAELLDPLVRAGRRALARAGRISVATVIAAALAAGAAVAFGMPWTLGATVGGLLGLLTASVVAAVVDDTREVASTVRQASKAWKDPYA